MPKTKASKDPKKAGNREVQRSKDPKPLKIPKRPLPPYIRFVKHRWESIRQVDPDAEKLPIGEFGKANGEIWRNMLHGEKQKYHDEYESEKAEYALFKQSPAYLTHLAAKELEKEREQDITKKEQKAAAKKEENARVFCVTRGGRKVKSVNRLSY